jgi:hypothetical protein
MSLHWFSSNRKTSTDGDAFQSILSRLNIHTVKHAVDAATSTTEDVGLAVNAAANAAEDVASLITANGDGSDKDEADDDAITSNKAFVESAKGYKLNGRAVLCCISFNS